MKISVMVLEAQLRGDKTFIGPPCRTCGGTLRRAYFDGPCLACGNRRSAERRKRLSEGKVTQPNWHKLADAQSHEEWLKRRRDHHAVIGMGEIARECGTTLIDVVSAWGDRGALTRIYNQSAEKYRIICRGMRED